MDFKRDYKEWIAEQKEKWIGKKVIYEEAEYTVVDVDYNGINTLSVGGQTVRKESI